MNGVFADLARWVGSLGVLCLLAAFWYKIVSNLTPFEGTLTEAQLVTEKEREVRFATLRKVTVGLDVLFFIWIVVEGAVLVPYLFIHFGLR